MPKGASYRPGLATSPERQNSFVPGDFSVPKPAVFGCTVIDDEWDIAKRFDVVDRGRLTEQTVGGWEGRLQSWEASFAFDRFK